MKYLTILFVLFLLPFRLNAQWQKVDWPKNTSTLPNLTQIKALRQVNGNLIVTANEGLFVSEDNGQNWQKASGIPDDFIPYYPIETDKGLFIGAWSSSTSAQKSWFNADKSGKQWTEITGPPTNVFNFRGPFQIGNTYFRTNGSSAVQRWDANFNQWQSITPVLGQGESRFTWYKDTLYINATDDRRIYRSADFGNT